MTHVTMEKKVMAKKGHQIFGQGKCTPPPLRENPGYAYDYGRIYRSLADAVY